MKMVLEQSGDKFFFGTLAPSAYYSSENIEPFREKFF